MTAQPHCPKASIAILIFSNMSGETEQEYFGDGLTEDIIIDLSQVTDIFVMATNTFFTHKGKAAIDQQEIHGSGRVVHVGY